MDVKKQVKRKVVAGVSPDPSIMPKMKSEKVGRGNFVMGCDHREGWLRCLFCDEISLAFKASLDVIDLPFFILDRQSAVDRHIQFCLFV